MPVSKLKAGRVNLFERGSKREREQDLSGDDNHKKSKADTSLLSATSEEVPEHPQCICRVSNTPLLDQSSSLKSPRYTLALPCNGLCKSLIDKEAATDKVEPGAATDSPNLLVKEEVNSDTSETRAAEGSLDSPSVEEEKWREAKAVTSDTSSHNRPSESAAEVESETSTKGTKKMAPTDLSDILEAIKRSSEGMEAKVKEANERLEARVMGEEGLAGMEKRMIIREEKARAEIKAEVDEFKKAIISDMEAFKAEMRSKDEARESKYESMTSSATPCESYKAFLLEQVRAARFKIMMLGYKGRTGLDEVREALKAVLRPGEDAWSQTKVMRVHRLGIDPEKEGDRIAPVVIEMGSVADTRAVLEQAPNINKPGGITLKKFIPQEYVETHRDYTSYGMNQRSRGMEWDITFDGPEMQLHLRKRAHRASGQATGPWNLVASFIPQAKPSKSKEETPELKQESEEDAKERENTAKQVLLKTDLTGKVSNPAEEASKLLKEKGLNHLVQWEPPKGSNLGMPESWPRGQILLTCPTRQKAKELIASFIPYKGDKGRSVEVVILVPDSLISTCQ